MHFLKVFLGKDLPGTQTTKAEQQALVYYSRNKLVAIEIGVFEGFNTALIASELSSGGIIYGVDPFIANKFGFSYQKLIAKKYFKRKKVKEKVQLIEAFSQEAALHMPESVDFIFIDGDHSWKGIDMDWNLYAGRVKQGGIIALHDTSVPEFQAWKGEMDSVAYFNKVIRIDSRFKLLETVDSLNILQRL